MTKRFYDNAQRRLAKAAKARREAGGKNLPVLHPLNREYYAAKEALEALEK